MGNLNLKTVLAGKGKLPRKDSFCILILRGSGGGGGGFCRLCGSAGGEQQECRQQGSELCNS